ncbi:beta-microseminoprotein isoform X2 [Hippopotamus amphibius kiboko]|uniref:beta-microseminoprotein isoform X2 n=1 Tax=Hippopotamus amphibius kiboko TaxID=575201 RepID=UPI002598C9D7|nr:beta-microseminoprotein isoform X2 [Hippopotamus amphibius kiboko]
MADPLPPLRFQHLKLAFKEKSLGSAGTVSGDHQNALLGSLVVLATFVTLCDAQCYVILNQNPASNECKDLSGVTHPRNSKWNTENCEECTCDEGVTNCCNTAAIPMGYDTDKCQKIFNKETCTYKVVEKEDPEKTCDVSGWVV